MYVAISNDLITRVKQTIDKMADLEVKEELPNAGKSVTVLANDLLHALDWREHLHLKDQIPRQWLRKPVSHSVTVQIEFFHTTSAQPQTMSLIYNGAGLDFRYRPRANNNWSEPTVATTEGYIQSLPEGTQGRSVTLKRIADEKRQLEIEARWEQIKTDVIGLLEACRSLNEAVKLVPGIKLYVDREDIERLERKIDRKPRAELIQTIDTDTLTAAAAAARLANTL